MRNATPDLTRAKKDAVEKLITREVAPKVEACLPDLRSSDGAADTHSACQEIELELTTEVSHRVPARERSPNSSSNEQ